MTLFLSDFNFFCFGPPSFADAAVLGCGGWDLFKDNKAFCMFSDVSKGTPSTGLTYGVGVVGVIVTPKSCNNFVSSVGVVEVETVLFVVVDFLPFE